MAGHPHVVVAAILALTTAVGLLTFGVLGPENVEALFLLAVLVSALRAGRRPGLFAALTATVVFDFCFIPPRFSFAITDFSFFVTLSVFVLVAAVTSELASRAIRAQTARAQAEAATDAKDSLLDAVAHELRTPLTAILGWLQILQKTAGDGERLARGLASVLRNAQLLERLVADLLDVSRIHVGKLSLEVQTIDLGPVVGRVLEDASIRAAEQRIVLDYALEPTGRVVADSERIAQVVTNLLSNALKFTPADGQVSLRLFEQDGCARLMVTDTGRGISPDFLPHVFEAFSQGQPDHRARGLGLGLAIVKHLIDAHHGRIHAESAGPGRGATFVVELPLAVNCSEPAHL
jgi:K+-sensing histidine kinase KdpD